MKARSGFRFGFNGCPKGGLLVGECLPRPDLLCRFLNATSDRNSVITQCTGQRSRKATGKCQEFPLQAFFYFHAGFQVYYCFSFLHFKRCALIRRTRPSESEVEFRCPAFELDDIETGSKLHPFSYDRVIFVEVSVRRRELLVFPRSFNYLTIFVTFTNGHSLYGAARRASFIDFEFLQVPNLRIT